MSATAPHLLAHVQRFSAYDLPSVTADVVTTPIHTNSLRRFSRFSYMDFFITMYMFDIELQTT